MPQNKTHATLLRSILDVFSTKIAIILLGLLGTVVVSRSLGPDGRGLLAALLIYPQLLVAIFEGGMRQASIYYIGKRLADEAHIIGAIILYSLFASIIGYLTAWLLMLNLENQKYNVFLISVAAILLPITLFVSGLRGYFLGKQLISKFNKVAWVEKLIYIGAILALFCFDHLTVEKVLYITILAALANLLIGLQLFYLAKPARPAFELRLLIRMMRSGLVYAGAYFLITANYQVDILILSWLASTTELGLYTLTVKLGELLWQLPAALVIVLISRGANTASHDMVNIICKSSRITLLITCICAFGLWLTSAYLVAPIFGADFAPVTTMLSYLIPGLILATLFKSLNSHFAGQGKPHYAIYIMATCVSVNVLLNFLLIPSYGANGAAFASSVSYALSAVLVVTLFCKIEHVEISEVLFVKGADFLPLKKLYWKLKWSR